MVGYIFAFIMILGSVGVALYFVGLLFAILIAIGNRQPVSAVALLLVPFYTLIYTPLHWKIASHSGRLAYAGFGLILIATIAAAVLYYQQPEILPARQ